MKSRLGFAVVMLVFFGTSVAHAQQTKHDGYWWMRQSEGFKLGFVTGYAIAMTGASDAAAFRCIAAKNGGTLPAVPSDEVLKACGETPEVRTLYYGGLRIGQFVEGIDAFYKDFRNSNIETTLAMRYVRDELRATKTDKELTDELAAFRQSANK